MPLSERRHENALADSLRIRLIINALHILTTFFCTVLHGCAHFGRLVNSVREAFPIFALSEEREADGKAPAQEGFYMILRAARNGRKGGTAGAANSAGLNAQGAGVRVQARRDGGLQLHFLQLISRLCCAGRNGSFRFMSGLAKESGKIRTLISYRLPCAAEESKEHLRELYFSDEVPEGLWQTSIMIQFFGEKKLGGLHTHCRRFRRMRNMESLALRPGASLRKGAGILLRRNPARQAQGTEDGAKRACREYR